MSYLFELNAIYWIQEFRTPWLDVFFKFLNLFDTPIFFFILIPVVWVGKNWKMGIKLFYALAINGFVNRVLKNLFELPRPFDLDPSLAVIQVQGYGLPSGAAQTVILLSGFLVSSWKSPWRWPVALTYIFLISLSRLYLGVHFISDLLAGWLVGFLLWALFTYCTPKIESALQKLRPFTLFALGELIPLSWFWITPFSLALYKSSAAMGLCLGLFINYKKDGILDASLTKSTFFIRAILAASITGFLHLLALQFSLNPLLECFLIGLWVASGSVLLCRALFGLR